MAVACAVACHPLSTEPERSRDAEVSSESPNAARDAGVSLNAAADAAARPAERRDAGPVAHDAGSSHAPQSDAGSGAAPSEPRDAGPLGPTHPLAPWPSASRPELVGPLVGPGSPLSMSMRGPFGTDLGWSFVHQGELFMLFGDTMPYAKYYCDVPNPVLDDAIARLPLDPLDPQGALSNLQFLTDPSAAVTAFSPIQLFRDAQSLTLGLGQTPLTGFSDGVHAFAAFNRDDYVRCSPDAFGRGHCDAEAGFECSANLGECEPPSGVHPDLCNLSDGDGCYPWQTCTRVTGFCFDPTSSQYDRTKQSERYAVAHNVTFAAQREDRPELYDFAFMLPTKKFHNLTARTVERFSGRSDGNDYRPGNGALLLWGRPGFTAEQGRQAQLYLMMQPLPLASTGDSSLTSFAFKPSYFAGLDSKHEPIWSPRQADAKPLAQDGIVGGDPHEPLVLVNQMAVSYLPAPIERWVMIYGGDLPDALVIDPPAARTGPTPGAIRVRYAEHPWGPWTLGEPLLVPGDAKTKGDPYGPGGFLFHFDCKDQPDAACTPSDPLRPLDAVLAGCQPSKPQTDIGHLYGSNVIDPYTKRNGTDGLDVFWNVSTWNPYGVVLLKTTFRR